MKLLNETLQKIKQIAEEIFINNGTVEELQESITALIASSKNKEKSQLELLLEERKKIGRKNEKEYQRKTYEISKYNEVKFIFNENKVKLINSSSLFLGLLGYKRMPKELIFPYFNNYIVFYSIIDEYDYCDYNSVIRFFCNVSGEYYTKEKIQEIFEKNNYANIFLTPKKVMDTLGITNTKSLNIRIERYNACNEEKIIPFKFYISGDSNPPKILYLQSDLEPLAKFIESANKPKRDA